MINSISLLRNVGQFDSVNSGANIPLARLTLIYAENGRGKTTLAAVLRSLATGDPIPIAERRRLAAQHPPHVVLDCSGGPPAAMFQNNVWNRVLSNMVVFDDVFVNQNVCSGLEVVAEHRQKLHELILGTQGVVLNQQLQQLVARIETHNTALRTKEAAIPAAQRGTLSADEFCALPARTDIDEAIQTAERNLAAASEQDLIHNTPVFDALALPPLDLTEIEQVLQQDLPALDAAAATLLQTHFTGLGEGAEAWVADGMGHVLRTETAHQVGTCPFCVQSLSESPIINHYRAYFSEAYTELKSTVSATITTLNRNHGGDLPAAFERAVRIAVERRQHWSRFCDTPQIMLDTATIVRDWRTARDVVEAALNAKQAAPLERMTLSSEAQAAITIYEAHRQTIATLSQQLQQTNTLIAVVKEQAVTGNPMALATDVVRLKAVKARHTTTLTALCSDYLVEKSAKATTEQLRNQAKAALEQYRRTAFPGYQTAINLYLERFNAGYRLDHVVAADSRGGPTCTYNVIINNTSIAVSGTPTPGEPSFHNMLSAGDRNTLALAFFFASLDQNPELENKVVVIDDPISSMDEHRSLTTVQELRRIGQRASQVIVLSHNKPFLCRIWEGTDRTLRAALEVAREGAGSTIRQWAVDQDSITENDRRHSLLRAYLVNGTSNNREVACSIRHLLEAFLRVAYPEHFPPGTLLGSFRSLCEQRVGTAQQILSSLDLQELRDLIEYANKFHHDTNPAWQTERINDGELRGFVNRAIRFARR